MSSSVSEIEAALAQAQKERDALKKDVLRSKQARSEEAEEAREQQEEMLKQFEAMRSTLMAMQMRAEHAEKELKGAQGGRSLNDKKYREEIADLKLKLKTASKASSAAAADRAKKELDDEKHLLRAKEQEMQSKMAEVKRQVEEFQDRVVQAEEARRAAENEAQALREETTGSRRADSDLGLQLRHKTDEVEALKAQVEAERLRASREKEQRAALAAVAARSAQDLNDSKAVVEGLKQKLEEMKKEQSKGSRSMSRSKSKGDTAEVERLRVEISQARQAATLERHAAEEARVEAGRHQELAGDEARRAEAAEASAREAETLRARVAELEGQLEEARSRALIGTPASTKRQLAEARAQARMADARRRDAEKREEEMAKHVEDVTIAYQEAQASAHSLRKNLESSARKPAGSASASGDSGSLSHGSAARAVKRNIQYDLEGVAPGADEATSSRKGLAGKKGKRGEGAGAAVRGAAKGVAGAVRAGWSGARNHGGRLARATGDALARMKLRTRVAEPTARAVQAAGRRAHRMRPALQMAMVSVTSLVGLNLVKRRQRQKRMKARRARMAAAARAQRAAAARQAAAQPAPAKPAPAKPAPASSSRFRR